jgi:hypothetical protein
MPDHSRICGLGGTYGAVYLCGGDTRPGPRDTDCPDPLHDRPLPAGYCDASDEAARRLRRGWGNRRCTRCGLYGWVPGLRDADTPEGATDAR